jgi:hypothetical protein
MALISWGDEEDKKDELFGTMPVSSVASVQSSWQPAPSGADAPVADDEKPQVNNGIFDQQTSQPEAQGNYLVSNEKAQVDQQKRQREAEIAEARRQAAAQEAAEAAAATAAEFRRGNAKDSQGQALDVDEIKQDTGWKKYYDQEFKREKDSLDFWGRLMDGGGASRRAETAARGKYNTELLYKAYDDNGNVLDPVAAAKAKKLAAYNSALAEDNSTRTRAAGEAIGAFDKTDSGFWGRLNDSINAMRQMSIYDSVAGVDDKQNMGVDDAFRFGGNVIQGVATALPTGGKAVYESARGKGTDYSTGFEKELDAGERAGRGVSGAIDVVGTFLGGSGKLVESLGTKVVKGTATQAEKTLLKRLTSQYIIPSLVEGGEAGAQAAAEYFGNNGTLLDENGEIDTDKVAELLVQTGQSAAVGTVAGGVFTGTAAGVNRFRNRGGGSNAGSLREFEYTPVEDANVELVPKGLEEFTPVEPISNTENAPVADGIVTTDSVIPPTPNEITPVTQNPEVTRAYHGSTTEGLTELLPGSQTNSNERRNLVYLAEDPETAANYAKVRGEDGNGLGELQDSPTGSVYDVDVEGGVLGAYDFDKLNELSRTPGFDVLSVKTKNQLTNPTGLSADILESNPELVQFLRDNGITSVRAHLINGGGNELIVLDPAKARIPTGVSPAADGASQPLESVAPVKNENIPVVGGDEVRALQEARIGKSQADEAVINQKLQNLDEVTPVVDSIPDDMSAGSEIVNPTPLTRAQVAERLMPKLADNSDVKARIAEAVDMGKDTASPIRDILRDGNVKPRQAERVATQFETLEKQLMEYNRLEEMNQRAYTEGGTDALDPEVSRERSRAAREMGITTRRLMQEIRRMEGSRDFKTRLINNLTDAIGTRNASVLTSAGLLERNIAQELTANLKLAVKNPAKMAKSTFMNGNILKDTAKSELSHWGDLPSIKKPVEIVKYFVGNTYRTGMIPTTALANTRRGAVRDEFTRWAFQELEGRKVSLSEAHKLSGTAGNEMEALVNTFMGVDNGMTNRKQAMDAMKAWKEYIRTGDDGAKAEFLQKVENHNSLADQMIAGLSKEDAVRARGLMAVKNLIFPFVRTATNLAKNAVRQDLNPFAKSLLDEIKADQTGKVGNSINLIKSKLVDYGIMGGAAALASSGVLVYNDGDEVDKPRGWSVKVGDGKYVPIRSTSLELPIAMAGTAQQMASDIASGNPREWQYYAGMITSSLPYIDQFNTTTGAVDSLMSGEDSGYAAKSYGVNMTKSFVPWSNNGVQPYVAGKQGESLNAKSVYDENIQQWLYNTIRKSYDPEFYNSLKDSRDNAGRVRTVDNQGVVSNKTINDANTAEFNDRITDLVEFGREAGLGKNTQDMFNSYDTGKNNNFKSVQDSITFLDVDGKPDNAKKLDKNPKLTDLSTQIRDGFFGDSGMELLTLDGKNLYSDVSVPNKAGTKNSKLPLSMQSIKNAIAQVDLPEDQRNTMYEISQKNDDLYAQFKAKNISYEQYAAAKAENEQTYVDILSGSANYQKMLALFDELDQTGFFEADGLGSTRSGQTYLWNSLNALLGSKGATPAANYPDADKGFTPWGFNRGKPASNKPGDRGKLGLEWTPVGRRQMASVATGQYTPVNIKVKLGNEVRRDRSQNYADRTF